MRLDLNSLEYKPKEKPRFDSIGKARKANRLVSKLGILYDGGDQASDFYQDVTTAILTYSSNRIPEIADDLYQIDDALRAGFGWDVGPFETWDLIGFDKI